jgi:hypothetical protein
VLTIGGSGAVGLAGEGDKGLPLGRGADPSGDGGEGVAIGGSGAVGLAGEGGERRFLFFLANFLFFLAKKLKTAQDPAAMVAITAPIKPRTAELAGSFRNCQMLPSMARPPLVKTPSL